MPALSMYLMRGGRSACSSVSPWLTPAQRAVRVLEVTRANWPILAGGRRKRRRGGGAPFARSGEESLHF